ncbi:MAG: DUF2911 domain-containing protein [Chryseolinea sp.]
MKRNLLLLCVALVIATVGYTQKFPSTDKSPMDMAYFPDNFAHDRKGDDKAIIRVSYSRPSKSGREIFGKLVPYGKVWRMGANEAAEIKFYQDVDFGGKKVAAGTYSLFGIPGEKEWTIILSNDLDYWGAYSYNEKNDVLRVTAPVIALSDALENFSIVFDKKGAGKGTMKLGWDKGGAEVAFTY